MRTLQFKIDGKWFGTYADQHGGSYDNNQTTSLVMMAYAQNSIIDVHFTNSWPALFTKCGVTQGAVFYITAGDYIKFSR